MFNFSKIRRSPEGKIGLAVDGIANRIRGSFSYKIFSTVLICLLVFPQIAGAITISQREHFGAAYAQEVPGTEGMSEMQVISTLKRDIQTLDEEIAQCTRKRKGWTAATVVGGVGVVGTGIAALVQNSNRKDKKAEIEKVSGQITQTEQQIQSMK
jgi:hypothetical protein